MQRVTRRQMDAVIIGLSFFQTVISVVAVVSMREKCKRILESSLSRASVVASQSSSSKEGHKEFDENEKAMTSQKARFLGIQSTSKSIALLSYEQGGKICQVHVNKADLQRRLNLARKTGERVEGLP